MILGIIVALLACSTTEGFIVQKNTRTVTQLLAKKKKASRPTPARSGGRGGFGAAPSKQKTPVHDDYAVFPALEPRILETLEPAPLDWQEEAGPLPAEILDRLSQIYGFKHFNGHDKEDSSTASEPLESLLLVKDEETPIVPTSSKKIMKDSIQRLPPFTDFRILHIDPLVLAIDNFMSESECEEHIDLASSTALHSQTSPTVGVGKEARAQRTSTTWYHAYEKVPTFLTKASALLGLPNIDGWEEVQTVRYRRQEHFSWHLDALGQDALSQNSSGQRIATLLVYLTENVEGGATMFRDLNIQVKPRRGTALLFFPAAGGVPGCPADFRTLHCGQVVAESSPQDKWIGQLWLRPRPYHVTVGTSHEDPVVADAMAEYASQFV
eukprot:scaffold46423_cov191-Amphora_coffeaeformis.AAC.4